MRLPLSYTLFTLALGITIGFALATDATVVYAWTGPTASPPNGNVPAPLNVGSTAQTKSGALTISGVFNIGNGLFNTTAGGTVLDANGAWVRTYGSGGWYNSTYGGGWYMADATYIRNYNGKQIYLNSNLSAPLIYDQQDAGYYVDPNGTTNMHVMYVYDVYSNPRGLWLSQAARASGAQYQISGSCYTGSVVVGVYNCYDDGRNACDITCQWIST